MFEYFFGANGDEWARIEAQNFSRILQKSPFDRTEKSPFENYKTLFRLRLAVDSIKL